MFTIYHILEQVLQKNENIKFHENWLMVINTESRYLPYGPSFLINGKRVSCSRQNMIRGRTNTKVFPLPVNAIPIMSRPDSLLQNIISTDVVGSDQCNSYNPIQNTGTSHPVVYIKVPKSAAVYIM
jgi:hypothetical protein